MLKRLRYRGIPHPDARLDAEQAQKERAGKQQKVPEIHGNQEAQKKERDEDFQRGVDVACPNFDAEKAEFESAGDDHQRYQQGIHADADVEQTPGDSLKAFGRGLHS
jgi:hypothetical protein